MHTHTRIHSRTKVIIRNQAGRPAASAPGLKTWLPRKKAKREILSLVGTLHHATKVVRPGRAFVSRMYSTAARLKYLLYCKTKQGILIRYIVMAQPLTTLEWLQTSWYVLKSRFLCLYCCFGDIRLCSSTGI